MSTKVTCTCDRCGDNVELERSMKGSLPEMYTVGIVAVGKEREMELDRLRSGYSPAVYQRNKLAGIADDHRMDLCRSCVNALGLVFKRDEDPPEEKPTLIDIIEEMVNNSIDEYHGDR